MLYLQEGGAKMSRLEKYLFKFVKVTDTDGVIHSGYVDIYTSAEDNDAAEESIGIIPEKNAREGVELYKSEIKSIEVIA
jgi:hypothetical protein